MPLALIFIPVLFLVFVLIKYTSYFIYVALGRREDHEEFMRKLKIRSGVFLFFKFERFFENTAQNWYLFRPLLISPFAGEGSE
jgi:hypothetical protein